MNRYNYLLTERKWQERWKAQTAFDSEHKQKLIAGNTIPDSLPLHMGHARGVVALDVLVRFYQMHGYSVSWSLGLPFLAFPEASEGSELVLSNLKQAQQSLLQIGLHCSFEDPEAVQRKVYEFSRWFFLAMWQNGLVYGRPSGDSCPFCGNVFSAEVVSKGICTQCGSSAFDWYADFSPYAETLQSDLLVSSQSDGMAVRPWRISGQSSVPIPLILCPTCGVVAEDVVTRSSGSECGPDGSFGFVGDEALCPICGRVAAKETKTLDRSFVECITLLYLAGSKEGIDGDYRNVPGSFDIFAGSISWARKDYLHLRSLTSLMHDGDEGCKIEPVKRLVVVGHTKFSSEGAKRDADLQRMLKIYGADTCRWHLMFYAPLDRDITWSDEAIEGSYRFICRVWRLVHAVVVASEANKAKAVRANDEQENMLKESLCRTAQEIAEITNGSTRLNFVCSLLMTLANQIEEYMKSREGDLDLELLLDAASILVKMLYPFIPHAAAELWEVLGGSEEGLVFGWPDLEMDFQCSRNIEIVVQINGKKRAMISVSSSASREEIEKAAIANPRIQQLISDSEVHKIVVVPGEVVNIVAG